MAAVLALAGCASISPDGLRGAVQSHTASRLPDGAQLPPTDLQARDAAQQRIDEWLRQPLDMDQSDRKSTRLNSSHLVISYAVFCLKKKKTTLVQYPAVEYGKSRSPCSVCKRGNLIDRSYCCVSH